MPSNNKNRIKYIQPTIMTFIWILLFSIPLLFGDFKDEINWDYILKIWLEYALLFALFLINRLILMPFLFYKGKRITYFAAAIALVLFLFGILFFSFDNRQKRHPNKPPMERYHDMGLREQPPPHGSQPPPHDQQPPHKPIPPYANLLILSILILGFDTGLNVTIRWIQSEQKRVQIEIENTENQLVFLRNQISPHFFMNTLNNIHVLVDYNTSKAKDSIIKLSRMMGYMLYETEGKNIPFEKEIQFINSYVELMQLRYTDKVKIDLQIPETLPKVSIPPLIFISFIENAFKYGISYQNLSYVKIRFSFSENNINFEIENSVHEQKEKVANSGIGIKNTRKRLDLIYGENYSLTINNQPQLFNVKLILPL